MTSLSSQPYKGTRDYFPEQKRLQSYIFSTWRSVVEQFGYEEYGGPMLEPLDIYAAKSGQELANDQTYTFVDRGGRTVAIRPEMTPTISRMVAARRQETAYPARLFSIANFMRYERPQRGREREFWQLNVDVFGVDSREADKEIITMADAILKRFGARPQDYIIRVNNRLLISFIMIHYLGLDETQSQQMTKLFDRRNKITTEDFQEQALMIMGEAREADTANITKLIEATSLEELPDAIRETEPARELQATLDELRAAGVDSAVFDATLMRGLDYYTGVVFEVFDTHPDNNRSLFGGGRYDGLVSMFGAEPISAVGMAPGGTMFENFLSVHNLIPAFASATDVYLCVIDDAYHEAAAVARTLRLAGLNVETDIIPRKLDKQIKTALKKGIDHALFISREDTNKGTFRLKKLSTEQEELLSIDEVVSRLAR